MKLSNLFLLIISTALLSMCTKPKEGQIAYQIAEKDLIPEGIAYSKTTNSFYLSSILKTKIIRIDATSGEHSDFIPSELINLRFLGLLVDDQRNHLWACGNITQNNTRTSAVTKFDLLTGELLKKYEKPNTLASIYNNMTLDNSGNLFFTNTESQTILRIDNKTDSLTIFYDSSQIEYPNGITISPDNRFMYVASTTKGIQIIDLNEKSIVTQKDSTINSTGIDGLKFYNGNLIGLQNEVAQRSDVNISHYILNATGTQIIRKEIIDQDNPIFNIPTTFVVKDDAIYCLANSQMACISYPDFSIRTDKTLTDTFILKYDMHKK